MRDEMNQYSGVAASYKDFPLSALRQMQSILEWEIEERLRQFGVIKVEKAVGKLGDVEVEQTVFSGQNLQQKSTSSVKLTVLKGGLK